MCIVVRDKVDGSVVFHRHALVAPYEAQRQIMRYVKDDPDRYGEYCEHGCACGEGE